MGALTPSFVLKLEDNIVLTAENEYRNWTANLWWNKVAKTRQSESAKENITWLLSTAQIQLAESYNYQDLVMQTTTIENVASTAALRLSKNQIEDLDGKGPELASQWAAQIGAYMAYWPQKNVADLLLAGDSVTTYDGVAMFSASHLINPQKAAVGTFANDFTGAASGAYPGALPIDTSVAIDVAFANLQKAYTYIRSIKTPNGAVSRFLRPKALIVPSALVSRARALIGAEFIGGASGGIGNGSGSTQIAGLVKQMGFSEVIEAPELNADPTTYYILCEEASTSQLGAVIWQIREPHNIQMYGPNNTPDLGRRREFEWILYGRHAVAPGHPYLIHRCKAS